jgi:hypothetical protein
MKSKIKYTDEPMGELRVVKDFLPPPDPLALNVGGVVMKRTISIGLWILGGLLLLITLVFGGASVLAFIARVQHGRGLMFADVEFFGMIALIAALLGAAMLFAAKKLSSSGNPHAPQHSKLPRESSSETLDSGSSPE